MILKIVAVVVVLIILFIAAIDTWFDGNLRGYKEGMEHARKIFFPHLQKLVDENNELKQKLNKRWRND